MTCASSCRQTADWLVRAILPMYHNMDFDRMSTLRSYALAVLPCLAYSWGVSSFLFCKKPAPWKTKAYFPKESEPFSSRSLMRSHPPLKALLFLPCAEGQLGKRHTLLCKTRMPKRSRAMMSKCGSCTEHTMILPTEGRPAGVGFTNPMLFISCGHTNSSGMVQRLQSRQRIDRLAHDG